jgi:hypothetical protein
MNNSDQQGNSDNFCRQVVLAPGNDENRILEKRSASAAEIEYFRKIHVAADT